MILAKRQVQLEAKDPGYQVPYAHQDTIPGQLPGATNYKRSDRFAYLVPRVSPDRLFSMHDGRSASLAMTAAPPNFGGRWGHGCYLE